MKVPFAGMCLAALLSGLSAPAVAVPITFGFTGTVTEVSDPLGVLVGKVWPQASFAGEVTFNSDAQDSNDSVKYGSYTGDDFVLIGQVGFLTLDSSPGRAAMTVYNSATTNGLGFFAGDFDTSAFRVSELSLHLDHPSFPYFTTDALPLEPPPLDVFQNRTFSAIGTNNVSIQGTVDSLYLAPEPATAMLVIILGSAMLAHRKPHTVF